MNIRTIIVTTVPTQGNPSPDTRPQCLPAEDHDRRQSCSGLPSVLAVPSHTDYFVCNVFPLISPHEQIQSLDECGVLRQGTAELPVVREATFFFFFCFDPASY